MQTICTQEDYDGPRRTGYTLQHKRSELFIRQRHPFSILRPYKLLSTARSAPLGASRIDLVHHA